MTKRERMAEMKQKVKEHKYYWPVKIFILIIFFLAICFLNAVEIKDGIEKWQHTENTDKLIKLVGEEVTDSLKRNAIATLDILMMIEGKEEKK